VNMAKFEIIESEKVGIKVYVLVMKPDIAFGYVIYQLPPVGIAEVIIGPGWSEEDILKIKRIIRNKLGEDISIEISKTNIIRMSTKHSFKRENEAKI